MIRSNPETTRAWRERSQQRLRERERERREAVRANQPTHGRSTLRRTPLRKVSKKRAREMKTYSARRKEHFKKNPWCALCATYARRKPSTDIHHLKGRTGTLYLDEEYWIGLCNDCHRYIHEHPKWAKANGWQISRHVNRDDESEPHGDDYGDWDDLPDEGDNDEYNS